jgi:cytochrome c-type biogenesis protein CcmF
MRPWIMAAWCALTCGIALGSWWAYYELGWGGWWFWDPVENASLMPWLAATALLHSAIVVEKRGQLKSWTVLLAIMAFSLSLVGTFIVRSGLLTSVHSFASDPARGVVSLGTLYPLALDAIGGGKVSVGAPFFNATFVPLMVPLLIACPVGAMMTWETGRPARCCRTPQSCRGTCPASRARHRDDRR